MKIKSSMATYMIVFFLTLLYSRTNGQSGENTFTSYGKPVILVFTNLNTSFSKEGNSSEIEITRAYLGYEHYFSNTLSSKVIMDVGDPGTGGLQMTAFLKNAFLMYKNMGFSARLGMIGTDQYNTQEKHWGYRYIYKSFQDEYRFGPSADLGAAIEYSPAKFISVDASILNGEGYKKIQSDSSMKATLGITIMPLEGLLLRGYYDAMNKDYTQSSTAIFVGYTIKDFRVGFEYNFQKNHNMLDQNDYSGISIWAALKIEEKFSLFTRYDNLWSESVSGETQPWNFSRDGRQFMAGIDYSPAKGVKIAPVWMGWSPADKTKHFTSQIGLHLEIRY